jgi:hypothetical protein
VPSYPDPLKPNFDQPHHLARFITVVLVELVAGSTVEMIAVLALSELRRGAPASATLLSVDAALAHRLVSGAVVIGNGRHPELNLFELHRR